MHTLWRRKNKMDKIRTTPKVTGERIKRYLEEGKRFDGRGPEEFRELIIEKNVSIKAEGSVRVKLGKTEVIVGVKMAPGEPYADSPDKGNLMVSAEMSPLSSPRFEAGPPKIDAIEWARVTDRGIRESGFVDFSKLCIKEGEKVWTVFVDIYSINDDGNLMDAANIGAIAAMKITKIPKYDLEKNKVYYDELTKEGLPLTDHVPISTTVYKIGKSLIVDPTKEEEDVTETRVSIGSSKGTISSLQKSQSESLTIEETKKVFEIAARVSQEIEKKIDESIK
jgi:exosome complex component RRP42